MGAYPSSGEGRRSKLVRRRKAVGACPFSGKGSTAVVVELSQTCVYLTQSSLVTQASYPCLHQGSETSSER